MLQGVLPPAGAVVIATGAHALHLEIIHGPDRGQRAAPVLSLGWITHLGAPGCPQRPFVDPSSV